MNRFLRNYAKKFFPMRLIIFLSILFSIIGCVQNPKYYNLKAHEDFLQETWMSQVAVNPKMWTRQMDPWYFTGEPTPIERYIRRAPLSSFMSTHVSQFNYLNLSGNFQVQIIGNQDKNSLSILGASPDLRQLGVNVQNHTLHIHQAPGSNLHNVVVQIGVRSLIGITTSGPVNVVARDIFSKRFKIHSYGSGFILMGGNINLFEVVQKGMGVVTVLGANSPNLNLTVIGNGHVNIAGKFCVHRILHAGNGCVNLVGAESNALVIDASGFGLTSVAGAVNLKRVTALHGSRVYVPVVRSNQTQVIGCDNARIGLAGSTNHLHVELSGTSRLEGQYLCGQDIYIRTRNWSHANVLPDKKLFADAADNSSIYVLGLPDSISRFMSGNGTIIPVWTDATKYRPVRLTHTTVVYPPPRPIRHTVLR